VLGRLQPQLFPAIFGPNEDLPLDLEGALAAFETLTARINGETALTGRAPYSVYEIAECFLTVANEAMARPIRNLTTMRGHDVTSHVLACFGGAGPQHCCAIARLLGMKTIYVHKYSGVLSAYGLSLADVVVEAQEPFSGELSAEGVARAQRQLDALEAEARGRLRAQGVEGEGRVYCTRYLSLRYRGTDTSMMITVGGDEVGGMVEAVRETVEEYQQAFVCAYRREYGFELQNRGILVDDLRVRAVGRLGTGVSSNGYTVCAEKGVPSVHDTVPVFFTDGFVNCSVFLSTSLSPGHVVRGPALIIQNVATVVIEPECVCHVTEDNNLLIHVSRGHRPAPTTALDPLVLSLFSHRFMGVAEQMGRTLQRTSVSVNIKERLDFSCALFDAHGGLVANAPHLPVHLGAMSEAVRYQVGDLPDTDCRNGTEHR